MAEHDRETFAEVVQEELEHSEFVKRLKAYEEAQSRPVTVREVTKHPLFLTVVGFLLTGAIGTWLENRISNRAELRAKVEVAVDLARKEEFEAQQVFWGAEALTNRRLTAGSMVRSAIWRNSRHELADRKKLYDDAYVDWNNETMSRLIELRRHSIDENGDPSIAASIFEVAVAEVIRPLLSEIDSCLTEAYDAYWPSKGSDPGFTCRKQPNPDCSGLVSGDARIEAKERVEVEAQSGVNEAFGVDAVELNDCEGAYWWSYLRGREQTVRICFDALSKDAFIYFRNRTDYWIAMANEEERERPVERAEVFKKDCGAALEEEYEPWGDFIKAYGRIDS